MGLRRVRMGKTRARERRAPRSITPTTERATEEEKWKTHATDFFFREARERNDERRFSSVDECLRSWEIQRVFDDNSLFFHDSEKLTFYTAQYYSLVNFCERDKWQRNCSVCCVMRERRSSRELRAFSANVTVDRPAIEGGSHGQWTTDERGQFK